MPLRADADGDPGRGRHLENRSESRGPPGVHRRVTVAGQPVTLTAREFKLLAFFVMHPDEPVTRERLLQEVWGYGVGSTATVTVNVRRLREKIEANPGGPDADPHRLGRRLPVLAVP